MEFPPKLSLYSAMVEEPLSRSLSEIDPPRLREASLHLPRAGGKRIRPALVLLSCEAVGGSPLQVLGGAVAVELVHTFSLVHDDIMDRDDLRRGLPTVHRAFDEPTAILAGDTLLSRAFEILLSEGAPSDRLLEAARTLAQATRALCEGQGLDIEGEIDRKTSEWDTSTYLRTIEKKTASLLEASTRLGAILGGGSKDEIESLGRYGHHVGLAFQIHDDLLDLLSPTEVLGKPRGSDVQRGKRTLPLLLAWERGGEKDRQTLLSTLGRPGITPKDLERVLAIVEETGALGEARRMALAHVEKALSYLRTLPPTQARGILESLSTWSIERTS